MPSSETMRIAKTADALDKLLRKIESGDLSKPDWIRLQGDCQLDEMSPGARDGFLRRLHPCVLRGFKEAYGAPDDRKKRLAYWQAVARAGFHDFSEFGWMKNYDSPFVENYDYIADYQRGGIPALDPYKVYSSVLGTFDFSVDDFVTTKLCRNVRTIVEPMAGTAEFCYTGHFRYPEFNYLMIDLDEEAKTKVLGQDWLPDTRREYLISDVLASSVWEEVKSKTIGDSIAYVGKQSHHFFDAKQLMQLMKVTTDHVDFLMLETPEICLASDMGDTDDLTRREQSDAGFECELIGEEDGEPNPLTHELSFRLEASKLEERRTMFNYHGWTYWAHSTLVAFAKLLDLNALYYHADKEEFVPVESWDDDADCEDNVTFMLFTRRQV